MNRSLPGKARLCRRPGATKCANSTPARAIAPWRGNDLQHASTRPRELSLRSADPPWNAGPPGEIASRVRERRCRQNLERDAIHPRLSAPQVCRHRPRSCVQPSPDLAQSQGEEPPLELRRVFVRCARGAYQLRVDASVEPLPVAAGRLAEPASTVPTNHRGFCHP